MIAKWKKLHNIGDTRLWPWSRLCGHVLMGVHINFFQGGCNVDISLILFQIANDAMQMDLHKMLYPFYNAGP